MKRILIPALLLLAAGCDKPDKSLKQLKVSMMHAVTIEVPDGAKEVRAWIPVPVTDNFQKIADLKVQPEARFTTDPTYGNRLACLEWKSPAKGPLKVKITYDLDRRVQGAGAEPVPKKLMDRYLQPDRMGVIDDIVRAMSNQALRGKDEDVRTCARVLYDFVLDHMTYEKETPGWGHGDTVRACKVGKGNCSDFHSLFISLARAAKIPARFHYGFSLKPGGKAGAHCWATFFDGKEFWVPVDISEADKDPSKTEFFFGALTDDRVLVSTGRDIVLEPSQKNGPLNFIIHPHVEADGRKLHGVKHEVTYKKR